MTNHADQSSILLQSRDYSEVLDVVDLLRSQGVSHHVPLPQIIVCGDQSSAKSSVLEAVSGVRFAKKRQSLHSVCHRAYPSKRSWSKSDCRYHPGEDRSEDERAAPLELKVKNASIKDFPPLVEAAKEAMGLNVNTRAFSIDVLRVEVTGPDQPQLTLVDLPGLIHAKNKQQSAEDASLVASIVNLYMAQPRSLILVVVSAKNDLANQIVTKLARDVDPKGVRTLGIITKPDTLHVGSESERDFAEMAKNEDVRFGLGWHVLKSETMQTEILLQESVTTTNGCVFSKGIWTILPTNVLGLSPLKPRLSTFFVIRSSPNFRASYAMSREASRIVRIGSLNLEMRRTPLGEQRRYLMNMGQAFGSLVKAAVGGVYADDCFGPAITREGYSQRRDSHFGLEEFMVKRPILAHRDARQSSHGR